MFVVIFEVQPKPERWDDYLETAQLLRPEIEKIDGFIDNERFKSERTEGRVLSLSTWRDEKALVRWRTQATHHTQGQTRGRFEIFADYHLRVGEVTADSATPDGARLTGQRFDLTEVGLAAVITLTEIAPSSDLPMDFATGGDSPTERAPGGDGTATLDASDDGTTGLVDREWFTSLTTEGKRILLASWQDAEAGAAYAPALGRSDRHRQVRVIRDYGMRDRREAPQYFPDVT
jgi:heme-degrading monooxygenase HmoA